MLKVNIINLRKTWEKLLLAARAIAAVKISVLDSFFLFLLCTVYNTPKISGSEVDPLLLNEDG